MCSVYACMLLSDAKMFIRIGANLMNIYESIDELYN